MRTFYYCPTRLYNPRLSELQFCRSINNDHFVKWLMTLILHIYLLRLQTREIDTNNIKLANKRRKESEKAPATFEKSQNKSSITLTLYHNANIMFMTIKISATDSHIQAPKSPYEKSSSICRIELKSIFIRGYES